MMCELTCDTANTLLIGFLLVINVVMGAIIVKMKRETKRMNTKNTLQPVKSGLPHERDDPSMIYFSAKITQGKCRFHIFRDCQHLKAVNSVCSAELCRDCKKRL